jgi:ParB family chromosome partitioning protein
MASKNLLDAFEDLNASFNPDGDVLVALPLDVISEDPANPRESFEEAELNALAASVREKGLLQPITVRPQGPDGVYVIRFGARRFRAAKLAGLLEINAVIRGGEAAEAEMLTEQIIENDQRQGLNTAEFSKAVARLLDLGLSQADIGRQLGRPKDQIAMLAAVRKMPDLLKALAPAVGPRTLYELFGAWKADAVGVERWLSQRDPYVITQADARALAAKTTHTRKAKTSVGKPRGGDTAAPADQEGANGRPATEREEGRTPPSPPTRDAGAIVLEVSVKGRRGQLLLDRLAPKDTEALVLFAGETRPKRTPLAQITLARIGRGETLDD